MLFCIYGFIQGFHIFLQVFVVFLIIHFLKFKISYFQFKIHERSFSIKNYVYIIITTLKSNNCRDVIQNLHQKRVFDSFTFFILNYQFVFALFNFCKLM